MALAANPRRVTENNYTVAFDRTLEGLGTGYRLRSGRMVGLGGPVLSRLVAVSEIDVGPYVEGLF